LCHQIEVKLETWLTFIKFLGKFGSEDSYKAFLAHQKWGEGFYCRHFGANQSVKGRTRHQRKFGLCQFDESATALILFHKFTFPLPSALAKVHLPTRTKKDMSSCGLYRQFGVHQETAWF
jgi:hypothetical protein